MTALESRGTEYGLYIGGRYEDGAGAARLPVVDPATGETWATIVDAGKADVDRAVGAARACFEGPWSALAPPARAHLLHRLADVIERRAPELAEIEVRDNGKLLREMLAQLKAIPKWFRYFAGLADKLQGHTIPMEKASLFNYTVREPLGVVACLTPWNSPLLLAAWKIAPALAAGNTVVVKPSEHASVSTLEFARCFEEAGFPPGIYNVITGLGARSGAALVAHHGVDCVAFTGSGSVGAEVAASASRHYAKVILELGGKSPNIVFADAPFEAAVAGILAGIFAAAGQTCIAGSRALVQASIYERILEALRDRVQSIRLGDPRLTETEMGPIANEPQLRKIEGYVEIARKEGARLVAGGERPGDGAFSQGFYVKPAVFADVRGDMRIAREEVFGPVLAVIPFDTEEEAIAIANDSEYGLAAGVWTSDLARAHRMARALQAGTVWVNTYRALAPNMPFGGYKSSGIGRESGADAIFDFTQVKSVWVELEPAVGDPFSVKV